MANYKEVNFGDDTLNGLELHIIAKVLYQAAEQESMKGDERHQEYAIALKQIERKVDNALVRG